METWTLIGMMGAGKTSIGRKLAAATERQFVDTDTLLQNKLGRTIEKIFEFYGEQAFRDHETRTILEIEPSPIVLSTGGGAVIRPENWNHLQSIGPTVYLKASADTLIERLRESKKKRPLLNFDDWEDRVRSILAARESIYQQASIIINLDSLPIEDASEEVLKALLSRMEGNGA
jgi:shikimate kinase